VTSVLLHYRRGATWGADTFTLADTSTSRSLIPHDVVFQLHPSTGAILTSWGGSMFAMPHGLTFDWDGYLWITDVMLHQVFKVTKSGQVVRTFGEAWTPGNDSSHFCKPSDVAVQPDGVAFISDGYCNSRAVVVHDTDGVRLCRLCFDFGLF
jgi:peptidylglycine monooxygenase / peptidylamidoglycolate lyase